MKPEYERILLTITQFDEEDVITTSIDTNNAYQDISEMLDRDKGGRPVPPGPWN